MGNHYLVPSPVLISQARHIVDVYRNDTNENRARLADISIPEEKIRWIEYVARELSALVSNDEQHTDAEDAVSSEVIEIVDAIIAWRRDEVLPRVKIALRNDPLLRHFRPGKLQSRCIAAVLREARLLVDAIEQNQSVPVLAERGVNMALAQKGRALIARMEIHDSGGAAFRQRECTALLYQLEDQLDELLAEIEQCAGVVFINDVVSRKRYQMKKIRTYAAEVLGIARGNALSADASSPVDVDIPPVVV